MTEPREFRVLVDVNSLRETFDEIEKKIYDSLAEMDLIQLNGMTTRYIKIDVKWQNGNEWNPYLDKCDITKKELEK